MTTNVPESHISKRTTYICKTLYWIALSLGFIGSLHCVGMCGPLAFAVFNAKPGHFSWSVWVNSFLYNAGRVLGYILLGVLFGAMGKIAVFAGLQRYVSVFSGIILLVVALTSINPDQYLSRLPFFKKLFERLMLRFQDYIKRMQNISFFNFGLLNGFLPCGLVYLALAGSLATGNVWGGAGFMLFFGLGTFPAMAAVILAQDKISPRLRIPLKKFYPFVSFILGLYLIYRGIFSKLPLELDFFEALNNPVLCH